MLVPIGQAQSADEQRFIIEDSGAKVVFCATAELFERSGQARILVVGRDLDDVLGVLHLKDLFVALHHRLVSPSANPWSPQMTTIVFCSSPSRFNASSTLPT